MRFVFIGKLELWLCLFARLFSHGSRKDAGSDFIGRKPANTIRSEETISTVALVLILQFPRMAKSRCGMM